MQAPVEPAKVSGGFAFPIEYTSREKFCEARWGNLLCQGTSNKKRTCPISQLGCLLFTATNNYMNFSTNFLFAQGYYFDISSFCVNCYACMVSDKRTCWLVRGRVGALPHSLLVARYYILPGRCQVVKIRARGKQYPFLQYARRLYLDSPTRE